MHTYLKKNNLKRFHSFLLKLAKGEKGINHYRKHEMNQYYNTKNMETRVNFQTNLKNLEALKVNFVNQKLTPS